jgi:hypothetical protein
VSAQITLGAQWNVQNNQYIRAEVRIMELGLVGQPA